MKNIALSGLALLACQFAFGQIALQIHGKVSGDTEGHNKVYFYNQLKKDSASIENGRFEITLQEEEPGSRAISLEYDRAKRRMYSPVVLFFDKSGDINVSFDIEKGLSSAQVSGLPSAATYFDFNAARPKIYMAARKAATDKFGTDALKQNHVDFEKANTYMESIMQQKNDSLMQAYYKPAELVTVNLLLNLLSSLPENKLDRYYQGLSKEVKASETGRVVQAKLQGMKNGKVGAMVPDFSLPDQDNKQRSFAEFKGKYVLLDFWASWCAPCRASFPRIREVNAKLKGKDFVIVNVSIDKNKEAWLNAVKEEANPWPQLYDNTLMSSALFNVSAVPTSYLIDPSGKIIMKEIGFDPKGGGAMEKKLEELFNIKF
ncbi:TlpA disulfide reductase family protein [Sphingobacterium humi]|uniref:Redoxin domain-containing protein n=1 Tax=Sphingobacterium humi TaxID=1796905 RepID=A0A6N8KYZ5_9SPHI|nr:TlpA disulfide reductase family protein [Sphingobacterium humi]MVZ62307.1 redoxin domain-containing protein [Sphingobacterium humi]